MCRKNRLHRIGVYGAFLIGLGALTAALAQTEAPPARTDLWVQPSEEPVRLDLTAALVDQLLKRIETADPDQAQRLKELRSDDPDAFTAEIRRIAREQLGASRPQKAAPASGRHPAERPAAAGAAKAPDAWSDTLQRRLDEFLIWFEKQYPERARQLRQLRASDPQRFVEEASVARRRYEPVLRAQKRNPALAAVLQRDLDLQDARDAILRRLAQADPAQREQLTAELQTILDRRFDVIVETRRLRFEELERKIEKMRQDVIRQQEQLKELEQTKPQATRERLRELLQAVESRSETAAAASPPDGRAAEAGNK